MSFITSYIKNTAGNLIATGVTAAGTMAGNAVGGVGSIIENGGRSVGDGVSGSVQGVGNMITGYGNKAIAATAPQGGVPAVKKTAAKPSTGTTTSTKKALPAAGGKPKALPAPVSGPPGVNKVKISAASRPKKPVVSSTTRTGNSYATTSNSYGGPATSYHPTTAPKPVVAHKPLNSVSKPLAKPTLVSKPLAKPTLPSKVPTSSSPSVPGKVKISAASRPKPVGGLKK